MQHKYRLGETIPGQLGDNYVPRDEMQDGSDGSSSSSSKQQRKDCRRGRGRRGRSEGRNADAGTEQAG